MDLQRHSMGLMKNAPPAPTIATIKSIITSLLEQRAVTIKNLILFGSRARGNFNQFSDYDILVIIEDQLNTREKIDLIESIRTELAKLFISTDIIVKSQEEADYYKEKIGSVVREAFKEGVFL